MDAKTRFPGGEAAPDRAMDGLLDELARDGIGDDTAFLGELEQRLDSTDRAAADVRVEKRFRWSSLAKVAALIAVSGAAFFALRDQLGIPPSESVNLVLDATARDGRFQNHRVSPDGSAPFSEPAEVELFDNFQAVTNLTAGPRQSDGASPAPGMDDSMEQAAGREKYARGRAGEVTDAGEDTSFESMSIAADSDESESVIAARDELLPLMKGLDIVDLGTDLPEWASVSDTTETGSKRPMMAGRMNRLPAERVSLSNLSDIKRRKMSDSMATRKSYTRHAKARRNHERELAVAARPAKSRNRVRYPALIDNPFRSPKKDPLSTFSIDVDTASYSNVRRIIESGQAVPPDAVRIEELINYFDYSYPAPGQELPFSVNLESATCPWKPEHRLVRVGLKGQEIHRAERQALNLVFLVDVSGSMNQERKLPLVQRCLHLLIDELREDDTIAIVTYAGHEGIALAPTSGAKKASIHSAVDQLRSSGGTNGEAGIKLAYRLASERFSDGGVNRILLSTDGDFNIGVSSTEALRDLVRREAKRGVFLSVLGFGSDNLNDAMLETITNDGNGTYHYIDGVREGRRVLVEDLTSTMITIAKDVKIQLEFNPATVGAYRLIGYANRMLPPEAFSDDRIDAGDIGAGHTVTAFYEIIPPGLAGKTGGDLKYQAPVVPEPRDLAATGSGELFTVKLRYKSPQGTESQLIEVPFTDNARPFDEASGDFRFAASVAAFGMQLRQSSHSGTLSRGQIAAIARAAAGADIRRQEFVELITDAGISEAR